MSRALLCKDVQQQRQVSAQGWRRSLRVMGTVRATWCAGGDLGSTHDPLYLPIPVSDTPMWMTALGRRGCLGDKVGLK